jgi:predicted nucleic acid-binding Zn ribbon protein
MICEVCGKTIETMIFRGTGVCGELCRKKRTRNSLDDLQPEIVGFGLAMANPKEIAE